MYQDSFTSMEIQEIGKDKTCKKKQKKNKKNSSVFMQCSRNQLLLKLSV